MKVDVDALKARVPILAVIEPVVTLRKAGHEWTGLCPFHAETSPSFFVDPVKDSGVWNCFGCGAGGDVIDFVMRWEQLPFPEACERLQGQYAPGLAPMAAITATSQPETAKRSKDWRLRLRGLQPLVDMQVAQAHGYFAEVADTPAARYLRQRGIPPMFPVLTGAMYHPNWYGCGRAVVFPVRDANGRLVAAVGRSLVAEGFTCRWDGKRRKVLDAGPKGRGVFTTLGAFEQPDLILVESPINALVLAMSGKPAIATCGASNHPDWLIRACIGHRVWVLFDNDNGGRAGRDVLMQQLGDADVFASDIMLDDSEMDWNDCLATCGLAAVQERLDASLPQPFNGGKARVAPGRRLAA